MSEHDETEILTDEQIEEGPAATGDRAWRKRLATAQARQDLLTDVRQRWIEADLAHLDESIDDPDRFLDEISQATGMSRQVIEEELDSLTAP